MIPRRLFSLCAGIALLSASLPLHAQDDAYVHVRFTNGSDKPATVKVWNPRSERPPFEATVEGGKSIVLADKDGKPLLIGLGSSYIQVSGSDPRSISTVANREEKIYVVLWTDGGYKVTPKAKE